MQGFDVITINRESRSLITKLSFTSIDHDTLVPHVPWTSTQEVSGVAEPHYQLGDECAQNVQESVEGVWFAQAQLKCLPAAYITSLRRDADGRAFVALKRNDIEMIMKFAIEESTRERFLIASNNRCPQNIALFEELVSYRAQIAQFLGYASYAEYTIQDCMLDLSEVKGLLNATRKEMADRAAIARADLMKIKQQHLISQGKAEDEIDARIHFWDVAFYSRLAKTEKYDFDEMSMAEYVPLDHTLAAAHGAWVWYDTVTVFTAWNEEALGGDFLGYVYLDLFHRPGKYNGNCNITYALGFPGNKPSISSLASFASTAPSLLRHRQPTSSFGHLKAHPHRNNNPPKLHTFGNSNRDACPINEWTSKEFHDIYGDCFISGFIEGGELHGVVSVRALNRGESGSIEAVLKSALMSTSSPDEFAYTLESASALEKALGRSETIINVHWMGGGQIQDEQDEWTLICGILLERGFGR
ncbi:hypothetical protein N7520_010969 [Penicillium odoratum]|uniref:uncharacterized protein n=1 Tax=Penicillium odoratum TaxID=1167516 RepID=UPI0025486CE8|nr:uncharacterized protein N7520_010969 [Penicillium odoratum]KAJ5745787.1 hypothetical protein N7520_010969 [Penicillium odoratum]